MSKKPSSTKKFIQKHLPWILLALIILVAIFFRFWRLNSLPPGLHPDEAANGLDVFRILENHDWRVLYATNGPREALFFYLQAIFVVIFGNTILALRLAPAIIGVAAVFVTYLWAKDWFGRRVGLLAAFVFAINPWAITITRDGFRASMTPLFVALVMYFVGRAAKTKKLIYFILAGVAFGLGLYTYTAFLMLTTAAMAAGVYLLIARRSWVTQNIRGIIAAVVVAGIIAFPLLYTTARHPGESPLARASGTSFLNSDINGGSPVRALYNNAAKTFLQFNWRGDQNARHNTPGEPVLDAFIGVMFLLGVILSIIHLNRPKYFILLAVFGAMLLTGITTAEGIPHGLRTIGAAPAAFILAALGINYILFGWYRTFPINSPARFVGLGMISVLLLLSTVKAYKQYFVAWAQDPKTYEAYSEDAVEMAEYLNSVGRVDRKNYVYAGGYTLVTTEYLTHKKTTYERIDDKSLESLPIDDKVQKLILVNNSNTKQAQAALELIKAKYPNAKVGEQRSSFNNSVLFYSVEVG